MHEEHSQSGQRFMGWRDMVITPAVEVAVLAGAVAPAWALRVHFGLSSFATAVLAYTFLVVSTLLTLKLIRTLVPEAFAPGVYVVRRAPWQSYLAFNLYGFLLITNLFLHFNNALMPPLLRSTFYWLLGAQVGRGMIPIGGKVADPHLVDIGSNAIIGEDALVLGHGFNVLGDDDVVVLGKVTIGQGAIIGARAVVMPGVTVGAHAMVAAMSYVPMGSQIPPYETWGGWPAKRISSQRKGARGQDRLNPQPDALAPAETVSESETTASASQAT